MGVTAPDLYKYFKSRDDLVTALVVDSHALLAEAHEFARDSQPHAIGPPFHGSSHAFRAWALSHPHDYLLMFCTLLPGSREPEEKIA